MEEWQLEFEWLRVRHKVRDIMGYEKEPDLQSILILVGINELGQPREEWSKEEKQDLMHIAVCSLLASDGYYEFDGFDADGWPHYRNLKGVESADVKAQEVLLKKALIRYFDEMD